MYLSTAVERDSIRVFIILSTPILAHVQVLCVCVA